MSKFLKRKIHTIFLMLGNECNLSCTYCLQHPLVHEPLESKINPDVIEFIREVALDNPDDVLYLQFYGGEPLVYSPAIKEVVRQVEDLKNIQFSTISNAKLLTDDLVEFFNEKGFNFTVSWDGEHVLETRGYDALDEVTGVRKQLLSIDSLGMSAVLSARNYPLETLEAFERFDEEYFNENNNFIGWNFDLVMDTGINNKFILDIDYDRVYREMEIIAERYVDMVNNRKDWGRITYQVIQDILQRVTWYYDKNGGQGNNKGKVTCCCSNGYGVLNLDLNGNLYPCHNTSESCGTIYDNYFTYLNKIIASDTSIRHLTNECKECPVVSVCNGGCKLVSDEARANTYCKLKQSYYLPVINTIAKYGSSILDNRGEDSE